jgi:hypothetical protein
MAELSTDVEESLGHLMTTQKALQIGSCYGRRQAPDTRVDGLPLQADSGAIPPGFDVSCC